MLSRVAAEKAPRTHNRRRVTGSSGRRREGRESGHQRPNMSRHVFASAALLLFFVTVCCGSGGAHAVKSKSGAVQLAQEIDFFVPNKTQVLSRHGTGETGVKEAFASPSLVRAGEVMVAIAEGLFEYNGHENNLFGIWSPDIVAGYIKAAEKWPSIVAEITKVDWRAHTVLGSRHGDNRLRVLHRPTAVARDSKVFLLVGGDTVGYDSGDGMWKKNGWDIQLVEGVATQSTDGVQSTLINWAEPKSLLQQIPNHTKDQLRDFVTAGGSGIVMQNDTLVFPLVANGKNYPFSSITYSTDNGNNWVFPESISTVECLDPRITEWETGQILMIVHCVDGQSVFESRDMGKTWTEAIGTLPGIWVRPRSGVSWDEGLRVDALITATIEERKVMLYTQRGYASGEGNATALYVWVTDNNRSFHVGPVSTDNAMGKTLDNALLYSDGNLHLLQQRSNGEGSAISLSCLTDELSTINSVLSTWMQKDAFFSNLTIPTAGLVAVLSNASASDDTWNDEYLCLNATVTKGRKAKDGLQLTESNSGVLWSVNSRVNNVRHVSLSHDFTLVATVTIEETPSGNTPLLTAMLGDTASNHTMGLSYTADKTWGTGLKDRKTTQSGSWEPKKGYQVALMLQGKKASVYIDGKLLGEEEVPLTGEAPLELVRFCFGACGEDAGQHSPVTVKNVFLYNRPLNSIEMRAIKDRIPTSNGPGEALAGSTTVEGTATTEHAAAVSFTYAGSGLLSLLLLGLWGFAAA
ncbi:putative trans-sialidase, Group II [Trypanosoma cruzi]|nr:putative trans-sialidase, Group II [Trypanosoma cruzi]PWV14441.1 putative trans-sialidase, Group II [Trypanosoma cruzi]